MLHEYIDDVFYTKYMVGNGNAHKHFTASDYKQFYYGEDIDNYNQVCIIRNIFDLVVSTFFQTIHINEKHGDYRNWSQKKNRPIGLDGWIDYLYVLRERKRLNNKSPYVSLLQSEYLVGCSEQCAVIEYEDYETQIKAWFEECFQKTVNIPLLDDKQLITRYKDAYCGLHRPVDYRDMYTDSSVQRVSDLFADDISIFNFQFDE